MKLLLSCGFIWEKCEETAAKLAPLYHLKKRCSEKNLLRLPNMSHIHFFQSMHPCIIINQYCTEFKMKLQSRKQANDTFGFSTS